MAALVRGLFQREACLLHRWPGLLPPLSLVKPKRPPHRPSGATGEVTLTRIFDQLGYPAGAAARQDGGRYSQAGGAHLEDLVRYYRLRLSASTMDPHGCIPPWAG